MPDESEQTGTLKKRLRWERAFLAALSVGLSVTGAVLAAGIGRTTAYRHREECPEFDTAWREAEEVGSDILEDEARRRAHDGVRRLKFHQGNPLTGPDGELYYEHEYSDTLLIFLLKARRPEKYREKTEHVHTGNVNVEVYLPANGRDRSIPAPAPPRIVAEQPG